MNCTESQQQMRKNKGLVILIIFNLPLGQLERIGQGIMSKLYLVRIPGVEIPAHVSFFFGGWSMSYNMILTTWQQQGNRTSFSISTWIKDFTCTFILLLSANKFAYWRKRQPRLFKTHSTTLGGSRRHAFHHYCKKCSWGEHTFYFFNWRIIDLQSCVCISGIQQIDLAIYINLYIFCIYFIYRYKTVLYSRSLLFIYFIYSSVYLLLPNS